MFEYAKNKQAFVFVVDAVEVSFCISIFIIVDLLSVCLEWMCQKLENKSTVVFISILSEMV